MATPDNASETKLSDFIKRGMDYFNGNTVSRTLFDATEGKLNAAVEKAGKLEIDLGAAKTGATTAEGRVKELEGQAAARDEKIRLLETENKDLKAKATTVDQAAAKKAAETAAAAGLPANNTPPANPEAKSDQQLMEEFDKITDPKARGEFYQKHFAQKFSK